MEEKLELFEPEALDGNVRSLQEKHIPLESEFDQEALSRIKFLAKTRGVTPYRLISDIVREHLAKFTFSKSEPKSLKSDNQKFPVRFLDPADQITADEDLRDLI